MAAEPGLAEAYEAAWDEWDAAGEAEVWDDVSADGLDPADDESPS
jgi:hypothetical protein